MRVLHDILVHRHGGDPEQNTRENHGDDSGNPAQNTREERGSLAIELFFFSLVPWEQDRARRTRATRSEP